MTIATRTVLALLGLGLVRGVALAGEPVEPPVKVHFRWSARGECTGHARAERSRDGLRVVNVGDELLRDLEVCVGSSCHALGEERMLAPGDRTEPLRIRGKPIRIRCAVLMPAADS